MANRKHDDNDSPIVAGASGTTPINAKTDPVTGRVLMEITIASYSASTQSPVSDDNASRLFMTATDNAALTPKALLSDPNNPGIVLADVLIG